MGGKEGELKKCEAEVAERERERERERDRAGRMFSPSRVRERDCPGFFPRAERL